MKSEKEIRDKLYEVEDERIEFCDDECDNVRSRTKHEIQKATLIWVLDEVISH